MNTLMRLLLAATLIALAACTSGGNSPTPTRLGTPPVTVPPNPDTGPVIGKVRLVTPRATVDGQPASENDPIHPKSIIITEAQGVIDFETTDVACSSGNTSQLQIRPDSRLAIKWLLNNSGISWCSTEKTGRQEYGVGDKMELSMEGTVFGVVLPPDHVVIKVAEGLVSVTVNGIPERFPVGTKEELWVPFAGPPSKRPLRLSDEERAILNHVAPTYASTPTPTATPTPTTSPILFTLTVNCTGAGGVSPQGCATGSGYPAGSKVILTAAPFSGYQFAGWSGACTGGGSCSLTIDSDKTVTSTFNAVVLTCTPSRLPTITLQPNVGPAGSNLTLCGSGFKSFSSVSELNVGDIDVLPLRGLYTDSAGVFNATITVPYLEPGPQTVVATVVGATARAAFTVK